MKEPKEIISLRIEKSLYEKLEKEAKKKYMSKTDLIKQALLLYFSQN